MSVNFKNAPFEEMITNFSKTLTRTEVTKTISNLTGDETLTEGSDTSISGAFFRQEDEWAFDKAGLFQGADAVLLILSSVTLNRDDLITYDGEVYRVDKIITRRLGTTTFCKTARLFKRA